MKFFYIAVIISTLGFSPITMADGNKALTVYTCGDDVALNIENIGWVVALKSEIGKNVLIEYMRWG